MTAFEGECVYLNPQQGPTTLTCKLCGRIKIVEAYKAVTDEDRQHECAGRL